MPGGGLIGTTATCVCSANNAGVSSKRFPDFLL
jgi:hypothetical protein